jgi:thioredoxin-dependent peroxiredoxin
MTATPNELHEGDMAPDFDLPRSGGGNARLGDLHGKNVVLYFYPKDDTSGCTKEARSFRDNYARLADANTVVLGISPDSVESHERFATKYNLPFMLLADSGHKVADEYGSWGEKSFMGKSYNGILRNTFLIAPDGSIKKIWRKVKPEEHVEQVAAALGV